MCTISKNIEGYIVLEDIKKICAFAFVFTLSIMLSACGGGGGPGSGNGNGSGPDGLPDYVQAAIDSAESNLTQDVKDTLAYMYSEESLAHDIYLELYAIYPQKQLENIATRSEVWHMDAVNQLAQKYDLNMTQYPDTDIPYTTEGISVGHYIDPVTDLYNLLYDKGIQSAQDALEVGCMVEVTDVDDLDRDIALAEESDAADVVTVFEFLRSGSYNHYWSFDQGLKDMGISDGCCSLGTDYCHPEYPQK